MRTYLFCRCIYRLLRLRIYQFLTLIGKNLFSISNTPLYRGRTAIVVNSANENYFGKEYAGVGRYKSRENFVEKQRNAAHVRVRVHTCVCVCVCTRSWDFLISPKKPRC